MTKSAELSAGDFVEVRAKEEILSTLDHRGQLEGLPFMPEMFECCGQRYQVSKRAHKTCDPPDMVGRRMQRAVHLEGVRCDGTAHGGCQARCLVFWKEAWLKRVDGRDDSPWNSAARCTEGDVLAGTRRSDDQGNVDDPSFVCQATQLRVATRPYSAWDLRTYAEDYFSGNVRLPRMFATLVLSVLCWVATAGIGLGAPIRWTYDRFQRLRGGTPYPWRTGRIPNGRRTPAARLNLQPGELVAVKTYEEILETISEDGINRGMSFDAEMVPYCGRTYRVLDCVKTIINERTGKMLHLRNDCVMLEGVTCQACYAKNRRFCSRSIYAYWREIWLERVT